MSLRHLAVLGLLLALGWASADASGTPASDRSTAESTVVTPLRTLRSTTVAELRESFMAWVAPARCDADGNVFLLLVPPLGPRGSSGPTTPPRDAETRRVLRISADGGDASYLDPARLAAFEDVDQVTTGSIALDPQGALFLLAWVPERGSFGRYASRQYVVSFDWWGRYRSRVALDPEEIAAGALEIFGSGEVLLLGHHTGWDAERIAVLHPGGRLRDVIGLPLEETAQRVASQRVKYVARAASGRIYFASADLTSVHVIDAVGHSRPAFDLAPMPGTQRLVGLSAAGPRLAATYFEKTPETEAATGGGRYSVAVYDLKRGERAAVYGPIHGSPLCYAYAESEDRFTVLQDGNRLAVLGPSKGPTRFQACGHDWASRD